MDPKKKGFIIPRSPDTIEEVYKWQNDQLMKAEASKVRSYAFERRQRLPYLIQKGLAKPGTISYDILRRAATSVHVARICVNALKEQITKTKWTIQPIDPPQSRVSWRALLQARPLLNGCADCCA